MLTKAGSFLSPNLHQEHPSPREPAVHAEAVEEHPVDAAHQEEEEDSVTVVDAVDVVDSAAVAAAVDSVEVVEEAEAFRGAVPGEVAAEEASVDGDGDTRPGSWLIWFSKTGRRLFGAFLRSGTGRPQKGFFRYHYSSSALLGMGGVYM